MQRKRIIKKIKPPIQEGRKRGEKMKAQLALMDLANYGICADDKKIAQRAREVCKALGGLSYNEAMATLHVVKAMCEDYCLLIVEEEEAE